KALMTSITKYVDGVVRRSWERVDRNIPHSLHDKFKPALVNVLVDMAFKIEDGKFFLPADHQGMLCYIAEHLGMEIPRIWQGHEQQGNIMKLLAQERGKPDQQVPGFSRGSYDRFGE